MFLPTVHIAIKNHRKHLVAEWQSSIVVDVFHGGGDLHVETNECQIKHIRSRSHRICFFNVESYPGLLLSDHNKLVGGLKPSEKY